MKVEARNHMVSNAGSKLEDNLLLRVQAATSRSCTAVAGSEEDLPAEEGLAENRAEQAVKAEVQTRAVDQAEVADL